MTRMETDYDMDFRKNFKMSVIHRLKFSSKIVEILLKKLLQCGLSSRNCFFIIGLRDN